MREFESFPHIGRISRNMVITEKIDGTNASIFIPSLEDPDQTVLFGSRTKYITPDNDNHGFARWATEHLEELRLLGPGRHFGEWWGPGIQRGYGLREKVFSLFNVERWGDDRDVEKYPNPHPPIVSVVPVIFGGPFCSDSINMAMDILYSKGSFASPGFMRPEGIVIWHEGTRTLFKKTFENDEAGKGKAS